MIAGEGGRPAAARLAAARELFEPAGVYLDTATYGLPPSTAVAALDRAGDEWRHGRTGFDGWDRSVGVARAAFARLHGIEPAHVAIGPQVSVFTALVAGSLPDRARVLCPEEDFVSLLFPFLARPGLRVRFAPLDRLAEAIEPGDALVACSAVQSADGRVADLDAIAAAAAAHGAQTLIDATQACGWLPLDAGHFDFVVAAGYKWLLNPRGTCFLTVRPARLEELVPRHAGWYAADEPMATLYRPPLRLAADARRLDVSPAWMSWVGAAPALAVLEDVGVAAIHAHDVGLANALRDGLGIAPGESAIVALELDARARDRLAAAGITAAGRGGSLRLGFHLYNSRDDVERTLDALRR